jgi:hypothetical protein
MTENGPRSTSDECTAPVPTVASTVLTKFFDELAKTEGFAEIAPNLRKVVLNDGVFAEPAIRAALFPDAP